MQPVYRADYSMAFMKQTSFLKSKETGCCIYFR